MKDEVFNTIITYCHERHKYVIANAFFGRNECDVFSLTHSGYAFEFEVKISRADFFADLKKIDKHKRYSDCSAGGSKDGFVPNRFFYVCPKGLIKPEEVPEYAGLMYASSFSLQYIKDAPLLHKQKTDQKFLYAFADKMYHRYFNSVYLKKIKELKKKKPKTFKR